MADQRILYTEFMVGATHPSLSDTLNRLALVEHENDGTHKDITQGTGFSHKLFNTSDEATNWEALILDWASNVARIRVDKAGTGTYRDLIIHTGGADRLRMTTGGILALGTPMVTSAGGGALVLANVAGQLRFVNGAGNDTFVGVYSDANNYVHLGVSDAVYTSPIKAKTTTGDPSGVEGLMYINQFDNALRVYADGAWRSILTW